MKMYFKSGSGIELPTDYDGKLIKEGDILTTDNFGEHAFDDDFYKTHYPTWTKEDIERIKHTPTYKVKWNTKGFFYGVGLEKDLYLHDFRFKHTKVVLKS